MIFMIRSCTLWILHRLDIYGWLAARNLEDKDSLRLRQRPHVIWFDFPDFNLIWPRLLVQHSSWLHL
jgi:hypothetical protein